MNRRLNCEALEDRSLPAVTASQVQGVLTVHLSNDSDSVQIGSATSDRVRVSGTGLGATFFTDVEELYVSDTGGGSGGASQSVVIQDTAMADRLTIPGAVAITGIENVTFSSPFYDLSVGSLTIAGAQRVSQTTTNKAIDSASFIKITATGGGDAIGSSENPLRLNAKTLAADSLINSGNQFFHLESSTVQVSGSVGQLRAGAGTVSFDFGTIFGQGMNDFADQSTFRIGESARMIVRGTERIGGLAGTGKLSTTDGAVLEVGGISVNSTFEGQLQDVRPGSGDLGPLMLRKVGTGTFTFNGVASHTGGTEIAAGAIGGNGTIQGSVVVKNAAAILPGTPASAATLTTGNLTLESGSTFGIKIPSDSSFDKLSVLGTVSIQPGARLFIPPTGAVLAPNTPIRVLENDGTDLISGHFQGLPQGSTALAGDGTPYRVGYIFGNDMILTANRNNVTIGGSLDGRVANFYSDSTGLLQPVGSEELFGTIPANVRVAVGDVNNNRSGDLIALTGPGTPIRLTLYDGALEKTLVEAFDPFGGGFTGGGFVATGDFDGDGRAEFIVTPDQGGGPRVTVFSHQSGNAVIRANFLGIEDPNFRGGARVATGDLNGDGVPELIVVAGFGGGPRVSIYDGTTVLGGAPTRLVPDFFAFEEALRNGVYIAVGDVGANFSNDLIFGAGPGGAPRVFILESARILQNGVQNAIDNPVANFFVAGNAEDRGGVRVASANLDGDGRFDVLVGSGEGSPSRVRAYLGKNFSGGGEPSLFQDLDPYNGAVLTDGVYVA